MSQPYVGEIRMFGGNFAPVGWAFCDGRILSIIEYSTLFQLIGTTYGGDGQTTFALPDLRGRVPMHQGSGYPLGNIGCVEQVTLTVSQIPAHGHVLQSQSASGTQAAPDNGVWAGSTLNQYSATNANSNMNPNAITTTGGSQPHSNFMPYLCVNFIISLFGVFPSQT